jgi:hypothetical protein
MAEWIDVTKKQPSYGQWCYVFTDLGEPFKPVGWWYDVRKWMGDGFKCKVQPTHWKPLDAPPRRK